ncbi:hypothetical protein KW786_00375 [Candidatus Parcubacteria bacterium]|nr:hypothetical protein [Candidatus Parcubacteria bacterium]
MKYRHCFVRIPADEQGERYEEMKLLVKALLGLGWRIANRKQVAQNKLKFPETTLPRYYVMKKRKRERKNKI